MKVPRHIIHARRERLAQLLDQHRYLPVTELCRKLGVSEATARRDLAALVQEKKITRTYGGALPEFNDRFPSFRERQGKASSAKSKIAKAALAFIKPEQVCFFDSGTTVFAIAEAFSEHPVIPLTVVTSNLPVGEKLASIPGVQVFQVAGQLLHLQSTLLGETAQRSLEFWNFDVAFLSAEAMNADGLWNSEAAIVEQQQVVLKRSGKSVFCMDGSKLNRKAPHFLLPWSRVDALVTDLTNEKLLRAGIRIGANRHRSTSGRQALEVPEAEQGIHIEELPVHFL